ncbi:MAG: hypothetical protein WCL02_01425 [bacterium]
MNKKTTKTKLRELGADPSNEKAATGKFRACVMIDSCVYHIGEDVSDREAAFVLCEEYRGMDDAMVQIFDDKGEIHIIGGKLKKIS